MGEMGGNLLECVGWAMADISLHIDLEEYQLGSLALDIRVPKFSKMCV